MSDTVQALIARLSAAEKRLERLEALPQRRLITDYDWLRGWKDDFFGRQIADQYEQVISGAGGTIALQDSAHGGWVRLTTGAAWNNFVRLWLGNAAFNYDTLDADLGWVGMFRAAISGTATIAVLFGAETTNRQIHVGIHTDIGANWIIRTQDGMGTTNTDSGIAADADWHWHVVLVYPISGGRQVDYFLDGTRIAYTTSNVPTDVLTPDILCATKANASRSVGVDYAAWIPRNLA